MVKMAIVTAETTKVAKNGQNVPCVVLIGRDEKGKRRMWRTPFWPYCYIKESDYLRIKDAEELNSKQYVRSISGSSSRSLSKLALTKLEFYDSQTMMAFIHQIRKYFKVTEGESIYTYEADLSTNSLLGLRYMIDHKLRCGVEIDEAGPHPIDFDYPLRKWFIDFETYSKHVCSSGPKEGEPIIMVTFLDNYSSQLFTYYVVNPIWKRRPRFKRFFPNHVIVGFKTEVGLLLHLTEEVENVDPDLISAWNLERFDMVKWVERLNFYARHAKQIPLEDRERLKPIYLSPLRSLSWKREPYRIKGRILFDLMRGFKRFTDAELRSYSLMSVIKEENLPFEKVPFKGSSADTWDNEPEIVFKRNVNDVLTLKALDEKYGLVDMFDDLRKEFGALFHEVLMNYRVLDTELLRFISGRIALGTSKKEHGKRESYLGAIVIPPKPGMYKFLAGFDFSREYPSIIKAFNISPETNRSLDYTGECYTINYQGQVYKFVKRPKGLFPQIIEFFFKKRNQYELEYKKAIESKDEARIKKWYRRVFNIKKMTNAIYGVADFPSFRLYRKECAAATAVIGRISIEELQRIAKDLGYDLVYGDTDSAFIELKVKDRQGAFEEGKRLEREFNLRLSRFFREKFSIVDAPANLGFAKLYESFLLIAKKSYAGKIIWDEKKGWKEDYDFKGLEVIRSDSSDMEKEVLEKIIRLILEERPLEAEKIVQDVISRLRFTAYMPMEVAYPLQIKGELKSYSTLDKRGKKNIPAHVRAAIYSNKYLNTDFDRGDKPRRLPILIDRDLKEGQQTLFNEEVYPSEFTWNGFSMHLKDISIAEDLEVPEWFIDRINWTKIHDRLTGKIGKIMELVKDEKE